MKLRLACSFQFTIRLPFLVVWSLMSRNVNYRFYYDAPYMDGCNYTLVSLGRRTASVQLYVCADDSEAYYFCNFQPIDVDRMG